MLSDCLDDADIGNSKMDTSSNGAGNLDKGAESFKLLGSGNNLLLRSMHQKILFISQNGIK